MEPAEQVLGSWILQCLTLQLAAGRLDGRGNDTAHWAAEHGLSLVNPADVPTNPHGNTIDLAFSNIPLSEAVVEDHLATSLTISRSV